MRIFLLSLLLASVFSCIRNSPKADGESPKEDTIIQLFKVILDKNSSPTLKMNALEKGIELSKGNDSLQTKLLYGKLNLFFELEEYDSFLKLGKKIERMAENSNDYLTLGKYYHLMGYYYENVRSNTDSAFYFHNRSKNSYIKIPDSTKTMQRILRIAILQNISNDYFGAKETLTEGLNFVNSSTAKEEIAEIYNELASNNRKLLNYADAISYYKLAIKTTDNQNDIISYKNNLATTYTDLKEYNKASNILGNLLTSDSLEKTSARYARILHNYSFVLWQQGELSPEIKRDMFKALAIRKKEKDKRGQISSFTDLGEYFIKTDPRLSKRYLDTAIRLSRPLKIPKAETDALQLLMDLEPRNLAFRNRYIFLKDSMYNNELRVKTQFAKMKYDDEQEKEQILELETETAQKRAEVAEQTTQKIIFLSLFGFLLLGGTGFLYLVRQHHIREKLQEVYNTEQRISRDLHDGLANYIFGLITKLQNENKEPELVDSLEDIYETIRITSHENAGIKTGEDFEEELQALIEIYRNSQINILVKGIGDINWSQFHEHQCVVVHRSIRELLVNMKKHSGANLVALQFENQKKRLIISYADNGIGFHRKKSKGIGLMNTENRILSVGGTIIFEAATQSGSGAKVRISMPS